MLPARCHRAPLLPPPPSPRPLPLPLLLALLAAALLAARGAAQNSSYPQPPDGCPSVAMACVAGQGVFDLANANCSDWVLCNLDPPYQYFTQSDRCSCISGYSGTDCGLVAQADMCMDTALPYWDNAMVNVAFNGTKHIECFLQLNDANIQLGLRQHRVNVSAVVNATGHARLRFELLSRHRDPSIQNPNDPHYHLCQPSLPDIACDLDDCYAQTLNGMPQYACQRINCSSCGDPHLHEDCSTLLWAELQGLSGGARIEFSDLDLGVGEASGTLITSLLVLQMDCQTGACRDRPVDPNLRFTHPAIFRQLAIAAGALSGAIAVAAVVLLWQRRRAGKEEEAEAALGAEAEEEARLPRFGLAFRGITYHVRAPQRSALLGLAAAGTGGGGGGGKRVLSGVTALVEPGQLVAIMGPSGAGKSSLLDILAGRAKSGRVGGAKRLTCASGAVARYGDVVNYVPQDDHVMSTQTVEEAVLFAARMRLAPHFTEAMLRARVRMLLRELAIDGIASSRVGNPDDGGGISGGERKRLSVAMELVTGPRILLLDEPTSGLDSFSANVLMQALQRTARRGCACVLTIHQPPVQIFDMFDRVLLLAPGGHSCFYGPPREALAFVSAQGVPPPSPWVNPAEFLLRVVAGEDASAAADAAALPEAFARSPLGRELARAVDACFGEAPAPPQQQQQQPPASAAYSDGDAAEPFLGAAGAAYSDAPRRASVHSEAGEEGEGDGDATAVAMRRLDGDARVVFVRARPRLGDRFLTLLGRGVRNLWRDPRLLLLQLTVTAAIALLMGVIFFDVNKQLSGIQNRVGLLFFLIIYFSFVSLSSIGVLVADRTLFLRERAAHYYDTPAYFAVKLLCDVLPLRVLPALALGAVVYWMVGLDPPAYKFLRFLLVLVLVNATATAVCFAVAAASRSVGEANLAASLFFIFSMLFGGLLLSNNQNSNRMVALRWASFFHYAYESLMANEFEDTQYLFNPRGIQPQNVNGDVVVQFYGLNPALVVADIYALLGFFLAFAALAFFFLARTRYQK